MPLPATTFAARVYDVCNVRIAYLGVTCMAGFWAACDEPARGKQETVHEAYFAEGYASPKACGGCHPMHYEQWRVSNHAYAVADPVFRAMNALGQTETQGELDGFCVECHAPIAARTGQAPVYPDPADGTPRQNLDALDETAQHGVSCDVCHTFTKGAARRQERRLRNGARGHAASADL